MMVDIGVATWQIFKNAQSDHCLLLGTVKIALIVQVCWSVVNQLS